MKNELIKIPKNEALVLAKHGHEVYMRIGPTGEPAGHFTFGKDVPVPVGRGPRKCDRVEAVLANTSLRLRPAGEHVMAMPVSRLGKAITMTIKLFTLTTQPITRSALVVYLARESNLTDAQAGAQVSEMLHRYKILEPVA